MRRLSQTYILPPVSGHTIGKLRREVRHVAQEDFQSRTASLDQELGVGKCFDMTARNLLIAGRRARLWVVNGYAQETILEDRKSVV